MISLKKANIYSRQFRLRTTLLTTFVLQIIVAVGLVGYLSFRNGQKAVNELANQLIQEVANRTTGHLNTYLQTPQLVNSLNVDAVRLGELDLQNLSAVEKHLFIQLQQFNSISTIQVGSVGNDFRQVIRQHQYSLFKSVSGQPQTIEEYQLNSQGQPMRLLRTYSQQTPVRNRLWYQSAVFAGKSVWSPISPLNKNSDLSLTLSTPVYDRQGEKLAVFSSSVFLSSINDFLSGLDLKQSGKILIIERNGWIVAGSHQTLTGELRPFQRFNIVSSSDPEIRAAARFLLDSFGDFSRISQTHQLSFVDNGGERQFIHVMPLKDKNGLDWLIVVMVAESDFMGQIHANTQMTLILCFAALIAALCVSVFITYWIIQPVQRVSLASEQIAKGDLDQQVPPSIIAEIDQLATSFNSMAKQLKQFIAALKQSETRNRAFVDAIPDLILRIGRDGTYLDIVEAKGVNLVTISENYIGSNIEEILPTELAKKYIYYIHQAIQTGETQEFEYQLTIEDRTGEYEARVVKSAEQEAILIVRDITERKHTEKLKQDNLRMSAELDVARQIQRMILPKLAELQIAGLEIDGFMEPAHEVGGDYYDVLNHNGKVKIGIGDVAGHGLESGVLMIMLQTAIRTLVVNNETNYRRFLSTINQVIYQNIQRMNSNKSISLALLEYQGGCVKLSGQHEEMLVVRANGEVERLDTIDLGFLLGMISDISDLIGHREVQLQPGDGVVLYTDGITEAENQAQEYYGLERLCEVVSQNWQYSANEIRQAIIADVRSHIGEHIVYDDITLLVLKQK
ncbi:MAG TPA: SpoIIE family protein phosphatase [Leptolyngbyaceae cyanobacterium]